jgi:predicted PurR-regulated permease PerM
MSSSTYHRTFLAILVGAITIAFLVVMRNFLVTVMLAAIFTAMVYPGYRLVLSWCRGRRRVASGIYITVLALLVVLPAVGFIGVLVAQGIQVSNSASTFIQHHVVDFNWGDRLAHVPYMDRLLPYREQILTKSTEVASAVASFAVGKLTGFTRGTVNVIANAVLMFYAMYFFLMDGPRMLRTTLDYLPLAPAERDLLVERFTSVSVATIKSTVVIGTVQGTLGGLGFLVAGIPGAVFWGAIMVVLAMIPGVGTALVWIPAVAYLLITGHLVTAIVLALYFVLVVGTIDNVLRPRLVGKGTQMHELLVLLSTLGGLMAFGLVGFIIGPVIAALFIALWGIQSALSRDSGAGGA